MDKNIIMTCDYESLIFRRRRGGYASVNEAELYMKERSEDTVRKLAARGINYIRTSFFKGFGLKAEAEEIAIAKRFIKLCHKYGIKVQTYVQFGSISRETMLLEEPDAEDWMAKTGAGELLTMTYGHQYFRPMPCFTKPGWWKYLRKVLKVAIREAKADAIGFDNVGLAVEPETCRCTCCKREFIAYLNRKYNFAAKAGRKIMTERFGFSDLRFVLPPSWNRFNLATSYSPVNDPIMQEWVQFKADSLKKVMTGLTDYIRTLKRDTLVEYNIYPWWGANSAFYSGIDMGRLSGTMDAFWNERDPLPRIDSDGAFSGRVRSYKLARAMNAIAFNFTNSPNAEQRHLAYAEMLAFNQGTLSAIGQRALSWAGDKFPEADDFVSFRHKHGDLFGETESLASVAILEAGTSLAYNGQEPHQAAVQTFISLFESQVPFDLLLENQLSDLSKYKAVILPSAECLSTSQLNTLADYVKNGGGLVFTGKTSFYDEWRRLWNIPRLWQLFGKDELRKIRSGQAARASFGKGRLAYLPELQPVKPFKLTNEDWYFSPSWWFPAKNARELIGAMKWCHKEELPLIATAPKSLGLELLADKCGDRILLHLVNYNLRKPLNKFKLKLNLAGFAQTATLIQTTGNSTVKLRKSGKALVCDIARLERYGVLAINQTGK